jgi:YHS domain-containing protein
MIKWLILPAALIASPALAQTNKTLLNLDRHGVALQGYDPVAFFTIGKPMKGDEKIVSRADGAVYYFATAADKAAFDQSPGKYEPSFGGYCAYGVSRDRLVDIDVDASQVVDGRLLLQYSKSVRSDFNTDPKGNLAKADANWPGLVQKKGK